MKDIPVLHCKLKRYERTSKTKSEDGSRLISRRYMIPIKKEQIEGTVFEDVEDIVILSRLDFDQGLQESQDINFGINELEHSLSEKDQEIYDLGELLRNKDQEIIQFKDILKKNKIVFSQRYRFGDDIQAACGQFATNYPQVKP